MTRAMPSGSWRDALLADLEPDEMGFVDARRFAAARTMAARGEWPLSLLGDRMSFALYTLHRRGLVDRLARVIACGGAAERVLMESEGWTDDQLRAWLARWVSSELAARR